MPRSALVRVVAALAPVLAIWGDAASRAGATPEARREVLAG